jgi:hypothetical protein
VGLTHGATVPLGLDELVEMPHLRFGVAVQDLFDGVPELLRDGGGDLFFGLAGGYRGVGGHQKSSSM